MPRMFINNSDERLTNEETGDALEPSLPCEQRVIRGFISSVGERITTTCILTSVVMSSSSSRGQVAHSAGPIIREGHLRKLKTLKKKYFVLRGDAPSYLACLEYYDSKKKFDNRQTPKKSIAMRSCFNINRRLDTKHMNVIALSTKDECLSIILDTEKELDEWLDSMLLLSGDVPDGELPRPTFEHVWQVTIRKKGLGERKNIHGHYRLCLTDKTLTLVKVPDNTDPVVFSLNSIRRCGYMERIFYMEVGRFSVTGGGDFWMEAEDNNITYNMHVATLIAMGKCRKNATDSMSLHSSSSGSTITNKDDVAPLPRVRSSSANEASKPISVLQRRHTGSKLHGFSPLEEQTSNKEQVDPLQEQNVTASAPSQCSQSQSTSSTNTLTVVTGFGYIGSSFSFSNVFRSSSISSSSGTSTITSKSRRHSVASHPHIPNNSHIVNSAIVMTTTGSTRQQHQQQSITKNARKFHQRTRSLPLAANVVIHKTQSSKRSIFRRATGRDRCDSLPSRARTTSEGHPTAVIVGYPRTGHLAPHVPRPHSMYGRGLSYSPPVSSMPISPASAACSTDSAGSSLSMDEGADNVLEESTILSRYGHSLTPDEPAILEENLDDYAPWSSTHQTQKYSPNFKAHSPSQQSSYVEMYSPCGLSPGRSGSMSGAYMPMSPGTTGSVMMIQQQQQHPQQHNHSRGSSLVEEPDGYVPMAPVGNDGYVDMDPSNGSSHQNGHFPDDMSQGDSSCSVTSGTPSTDLRFSEYHLDKVTSFLVPGEETPARPTRAYSVGSRPEPTSNRHRKNRLDIAQQDASRVRAFSVGSRSKKAEIFGRLANVITSRLTTATGDCNNSNKSNSAPLLSSSWGHNSGCSVTSERMEDLMELDFTKPNGNNQDNLNSPISLSYSQSRSQSYSTATDTSSYVDMSPGQAHASSNITAINNSTTAPYVDMSGINKTNRNNSNNNNNSTTANHNHNQVQATTSISSMIHKPVIKTLKPVEETEGAYMRMESSMEDWPRAGSSPKQVPSPMQDDYMQMNGPPGVTRTAPVDLPQPRRPPEGYVEMTFKSRPSLEQDYINITMGGSGSGSGSGSSTGVGGSRRLSVNRNRGRNTRGDNRTDKSHRSQPIAIQASTKTVKTPSFLPLNDSPTSESLGSTPASPPRATPTGSNATIFPFSLNSPQSPIKPFTATANTIRESENGQIYGSPSMISDDYALMSPSAVATTDTAKLPKTNQEVPQNPLTKRLTDLVTSRTRSPRNTDSTTVNISKDDASSVQDKLPKKSANSSIRSVNNQSDGSQSPSIKSRGGEVAFYKMKNLRGKDDNIATIGNDEQAVVPTSTTNQISQQSLSTNSLTKRFGDLLVIKAKVVQPSPNTSPTPNAGFKITQKSQQNSGNSDDSAIGSLTATATPNVATSGAGIVAPMSPLDSEGYEKLQPGATILHYASLDLPEVGNAPPVSPTPVNEGFSYAEIDFAKLKQN